MFLKNTALLSRLFSTNNQNIKKSFKLKFDFLRTKSFYLQKLNSSSTTTKLISNLSPVLNRTQSTLIHPNFTSSSPSPSSSSTTLNSASALASLKLSKPIIGYWYLIASSLVFGIVIIGGLTRLTESGLSITEWSLIKGMKYPTSPEAWDIQFSKYKSTPEYALMNNSITLSDFQFIYFMEWAHRMWGRMIGVAFIVPGVVFAMKGYMTPQIQRRTLLVSALIGMQGGLGWYMVSSGLDANHIKERPVAVPRVSQYRLAAHLGSAFLIYSIMLATGLEIIKSNKLQTLPQLTEILSSTKQLARFKLAAKAITGLVFLTAISGAFVAGLDAGLIYNEFPKMGEGYIPSDMWALSDGVNATAVTAIWIYSKKLKLPKQAKLAVNVLMGVAMFQVSLGVSTLIYFVPVPLAAAHQSGSLTLLSFGIWLLHTLRRIPKI